MTTWHVGNLWKSNPSIFEITTVARWGEISSLGKWTVLQVKFVKWHDSSMPLRHIICPNSFPLESQETHLSHKRISAPLSLKTLQWRHCSSCHTNFASQSHAKNLKQTAVSTWKIFLHLLTTFEYHEYPSFKLAAFPKKNLQSYHLTTFTKRHH